MTPDKQRTAIAEACGYSAVSFDDREHVDIDTRSVQMWTQWMGAKHGVRIHVPDYLNDLNAMHAAEGWLSRGNGYHQKGFGRYRTALTEVCAEQHPIDATAAQRAEAFLKTIGKWEDGK